jgi:hypothetical protein
MAKTPTELREDIFKKLIQYHARKSRTKKEKKKQTAIDEIWIKRV